MSTGYGWKGLRQVCATLLGACPVPECLCSGLVYLGRYNKCSPLPFLLTWRDTDTHETDSASIMNYKDEYSFTENA